MNDRICIFSVDASHLKSEKSTLALPKVVDLPRIFVCHPPRELRTDTVSQILTMANIHSNINVLLLENTQSFLAGAILHRMAGNASDKQRGETGERTLNK